MSRPVIFLILSIPLILISWKVFFKFRSHGLYRFLAWECILWLLVNNIPYWFVHPLHISQIISWILLVLSLYVLIAGTLQIRKMGHISRERKGTELYNFEKTTHLVTDGIYKYIRHPMYSSLLFLTWGTFFKYANLSLLFVAILSSILLYITARLEELENIVYFGKQYVEYKKNSYLFIPYVI
jgi:protein-S-isoprenylcysteine O-methyltransferase Ste14